MVSSTSSKSLYNSSYKYGTWFYIIDPNTNMFIVTTTTTVSTSAPIGSILTKVGYFDGTANSLPKSLNGFATRFVYYYIVYIIMLALKHLHQLLVQIHV